MQDLIKQEQFELEVLDVMNSHRILKDLVFCGGTMLRLCFGLNRFSVDLDFWTVEVVDREKLSNELKNVLAERYNLTDAASKFHTPLFEFRSPRYPRRLKIEIRDKPRKVETEPAIAFSAFSNLQVLLEVVSLKEMMREKVGALIDRKEIRDAFDMEFLHKKGIPMDVSGERLADALKVINAFRKTDYSSKLGSLLDETQREYYAHENFKLLKMVIQEIIENER